MLIHLEAERQGVSVKAYPSPMALYLDPRPDGDEVQPDLTVVLPDDPVETRHDPDSGWALVGTPWMVVEIMSRTTWRDDLDRKKRAYARAGVGLYLFVDLKDAARPALRRPGGRAGPLPDRRGRVRPRRAASPGSPGPSTCRGCPGTRSRRASTTDAPPAGRPLAAPGGAAARPARGHPAPPAPRRAAPGPRRAHRPRRGDPRDPGRSAAPATHRPRAAARRPGWPARPGGWTLRTLARERAADLVRLGVVAHALRRPAEGPLLRASDPFLVTGPASGPGVSPSSRPPHRWASTYCVRRGSGALPAYAARRTATRGGAGAS